MKKVLVLAALSFFINQGNAMDKDFGKEDFRKNKTIDTFIYNIKKYNETNLDQKTQEEIEIAVTKLENTSEALQKNGIKKLISLCAKLNIDKELKEAISIQEFLDELPRKRLQNAAKRYFQQNMEAVDVSFKDKLGGDQLGNRIIVTLKDGQEITYHAKTHRGGLKSQHSSSSQPVDLKELLIYKVLDFSGIGAEAHFFYDDIKNFYIATKDAGYDEFNKTQGVFLTYEKIKEKISHEELLKNSDIINGFIKADIISRLLLMSDVINNSANTGLSPNSQFKIIDFNPPLNLEYRNPGIFKDWLSGNNQYNYSDPTVISILKNKNKEEKIYNSLTIFKELEKFKQFVYNAYDCVIKNINELEGIAELQKQDLKEYAQSVTENYDSLNSGF